MQGLRFAMPLVAVLALATLTLKPHAQDETPDDAPPAPLQTTKSYDLSGLTLSELNRSSDVGKSLDWLAADRVMQPVISSEIGFDWQLRNSIGGARAWADVDTLMNAAFEFCNTGSEEIHWAADATGSPKVLVSCDEEMHRRISWVVETLRLTAAVRVRFRAHDLPAQSGFEPCIAAGEVAKVAKSGTLLGSWAGPLGECALFQRLKLQGFVQGYSSDTEASSPASAVAAQLATGRELICSALLMPDGRVWVHGWAASQELVSLRRVETTKGSIELPRVRYGFAPFSALLENRGGIIIDEGDAGRTLLVCEVEGSMPNRTLECGTHHSLGLVNIAGMLVAETAEFPWLAGGDSEGQLHELGRTLDGPGHNGGRFYALSGASERLAAGLALTCENLGQAFSFGPYLALRISQPDRDSGTPPSEEFETSHQELATTLARINAGRQCLSLRVMAWRIDAKTQLPETVIGGKPTPAELQALGVAGFDRSVTGLVDQTLQLLDFEIAARLLESGRAGMLCWGTQARLSLRAAPEGRVALELRLGMAEGDRKLEAVETGTPAARSTHERGVRLLAQGDLSGTLAVGEATSCVVPAPSESGWLVIAVQRLR